MAYGPHDLLYVYEGWEGYNRSLVSAIAPLTAEQLRFQSTAEMRSVGEVAWHIADGRVDWFKRINPEDCAPLVEKIEARKSAGPDPEDAALIREWLGVTWGMVEKTLKAWTIDDLSVTFDHPYQNKTFVVHRQWVIWRMITHDMHHGGQLSELLAMQNIFPLELTYLGGHLTDLPTRD